MCISFFEFLLSFTFMNNQVELSKYLYTSIQRQRSKNLEKTKTLLLTIRKFVYYSLYLTDTKMIYIHRYLLLRKYMIWLKYVWYSKEIWGVTHLQKAQQDWTAYIISCRNLTHNCNACHVILVSAQKSLQFLFCCTIVCMPQIVTYKRTNNTPNKVFVVKYYVTSNSKYVSILNFLHATNNFSKLFSFKLQ